MEAVEDKGIARLVPKGVRFICPLWYAVAPGIVGWLRVR